MAIHEWSAGEIAARITGRDISVREVVSAFLKRADETNRILNAVCTSTAEEAMEAATGADERLARGYPARLLEGVPFTVKDIIPVKGVRCTYGSQLYKDLVPDESAVAVDRLVAAGAILVGKSNTPEMADDPFCNTTNELFGQTRNPWDVNRTPGGSSGGGSAAAAAGIAPIALGTDWGGSVRGPAAWCGIVGMRPSAGIVPVYPDDTRCGFSWDFAVEHVHAPMAPTVSDVAQALSVLVGRDPRAPAAIASSLVGALGPISGDAVDLRGRRVAVTTDFGGLCPVDPEIKDCVLATGRLLESLGCIVTETSPDFSTLNEIILGSRALGVAIRYSGYAPASLEQLSKRLRDQIAAAYDVDLIAVSRAERLRSSLVKHVREFFNDFDLVLSPTWGVHPFKIDQPFDSRIAGVVRPNFFDTVLFTYSMSVLGNPSISVPAQLSESGVPIGVQFAGPWFADRDVLYAAAAFELARGSLGAPPDISLQTPNPVDPMFLDSPGTVAWRSGTETP